MRFLLLLFSVATATATIIPANRVITWDPGVRGGIPTRTVISTTLSPGVSAATINAAINNANSGEIVKLNAGIYNLSDRIVVGKSGVLLRGAGMGQTIINGNGNTHMLLIGNPSADTSWTAGTAKVLTSTGLTKGSTTINTSTSHGWSPGDYVMLDQLNDTTGDPPRGASGPGGNCNWCGRESGFRATTQWVKIVTTPSATSATITPGLYMTFSTALQAQGYKAIGVTQDVGVEDITFNNQAATKKRIVDMNYCVNSWLQRVELIGSNERSMQVYGGMWNDITGCKFHEGTPAYQPPQYKTNRAYGLFLGPGPSAFHVYNNQFYNLTVGVAFEGGPMGNVVAYNLVTSMKWDDPVTGAPDLNVGRMTILGHGGHTEQNLVEGNWMDGRFGIDSYWGTGAYNTVYRNHIAQQFPRTEQTWTVDIERRDWYNNIVGNILGTVGVETRYQLDGINRLGGTPPNQPDACAPYGNGPKYLYRLGFGPLDECMSPDGDVLVRDKTYRHGNWDSINQTQVWETTNADHSLPDSLYLVSKPSYFGNKSWPPFDPAVPAAATVDDIPAGCRYTAGCTVSGTPSPTATATSTPTASPQPTPTPSPTPTPPETFAQAININGPAATINGHSWLAQSASGFQTANLTYTNSSFTWVPSVDTPTKTMLDTGIYCAQCNIYFSLPLAPKNYDIYLWMTESWQSNFRSFNLKFEGVQADTAIGLMPRGEWRRYGPYPVTITDGVLDVDLEVLTGDPVINGIEVWTVSNSTPTPSPTSSPTVTATPTPTVTPTPAGTSAGIIEVSAQRATMTAVNANSALKAYPGPVKAGQFLLIVGVAKGGLDQTSVQVYDTRNTIYNASFGTSSTTTTTNKITFIAWGTAQTSGANTVVVNPAGSSSSFSWTQHVFEGTAMGPVDPRFLTVDEAIALVDTDGGDTQGTMVASTAGNASDTLTVSANALIVGVFAHTNTTPVATIAGEGYTKFGGTNFNTTWPAHAAIFRLPATATEYTPNIDYGAGDASDKTWTLQTYSFRPAATDFPIGGAAATRSVNKLYNPRR